MAVHRIHLYYSKSNAKTFHEWLTQWQSDKPTSTTDEVVNDIPESPVSTQTDTDAEYYRVSLTYEFSMSAVTVFREPYEALVKHCQWSVVAYHQCTHDEIDPVNCDWDRVERDQPVPDYVPSVSAE
jgi:hypothetical protein